MATAHSLDAGSRTASLRCIQRTLDAEANRAVRMQVPTIDPMTISLTHSHGKVLVQICQSIEERCYPPTNREIQEAQRLSSTSVADSRLQALENWTLIWRPGNGNSRAITVTALGWKVRRLIADGTLRTRDSRGGAPRFDTSLAIARCQEARMLSGLTGKKPEKPYFEIKGKKEETIGLQK